MVPETVNTFVQIWEVLDNQHGISTLFLASNVLRTSEPHIPALTWALSAGVTWTQHQVHEAVVFCFQEFRGSSFDYIVELSRILLYIVQLHKSL